MTENQGSESATDGAVARFSVKRVALWLLRKIRDHFVSLAIAGAVGFGAGLLFTDNVSQLLQQNSFGAHCAIDVFNGAKADGVALIFEPESVEHMAICGPGKYRGESATDILDSYINTYQPNCLSLEKGQGKYIISPSEGEEVIVFERDEGPPFYTCRCKDDQAAVMFKYVPELCGMPTPGSTGW